ncbi:hypothetical protein ACTA71_003521 [Dictyostelium dimigraforme]
MVYHSQFNDESAGFRLVGNVPILPLKTTHKGPAPKGDANSLDIIDEALDLFKANILFRNFEVQGNGDRVLIYLTLYITKCLLKIAPMNKADAEKALFLIAQEQFSIPGESAFPLGGLVTVPNTRDGNNNSSGGGGSSSSSNGCCSNSSNNCLAVGRTADTLRQYFTQLRLELGVRLCQRVYAVDPARANKWWICFSKRKFLNKAL